MLAAASTVDWDGQSPVNFGVNSDSMLSNAKLRITTYDGRIVDEVELGGVGPEIKSLSWDGNTKEGPAALSGKYRILVEGLTFDGKTVNGNVLTGAMVQSVQRSGSSVQVLLNDGRVVNDPQIVQIGSVNTSASGS